MDLTAKFENYCLINIASLVPASWNYKEDDEEKSEALANNLKRNGQIENVIVRELETGAYEVVNGNHRYHAMLKLGSPNIIACNLGPISLGEAQRIAVETNETRFKTDQLKLSSLMKELLDEQSAKELALTMPYTAREIELMAGLADFSWDAYASGEPGHGAGAGIGASDGFVEVTYRLPSTVATLLAEQLTRIRRAITKANGTRCDDDIRPVEYMALLVRDMSDGELLASLAGET